MYLYVIIETEFECFYKKGFLSTRMTRTSRTTGEIASRYRHLEFEWSYDEGKALVNSYDSYESYNW